MKNFAIIAFSLVLSLTADVCLAMPAWSGSALARWKAGAHQLRDVRLADGVLTGRASGSDAFFDACVDPFDASAAQEIVFLACSPVGGHGEVFWGTERMTALNQKHSVSFRFADDGQWHEYWLRPFWHGEGKINRLRIDFPSTAVGKDGLCGIKEVRIDRRKGASSLRIGDNGGVAFTVKSETPGRGEFVWATDAAAGRRRRRFVIPGDGLPHRFLLDLTTDASWKGTLAWWEVRDRAKDAAIKVSDFALVADPSEAPASLYVRSARIAEAIPRVGQDLPIEVVVENLGGEAAQDVRLEAGYLPRGVTVFESADTVREVDGGLVKTFSLNLRVTEPGKVVVPLALKASGQPSQDCTVSAEVLPSLGLPRADYVPEPKPVKTDYDLAALYFPGWCSYERWDRVRRLNPERKPVLGWYDERKVEIVDWQIKWLVENGIRTLYVDWYWCKGQHHLDHWVKAFQKAKYRSHLKWAMMWANHTPEGSHSVEDQRAVTKFWIENYFNTPEYLKIDGKPVVWIWQAQNMDRDLGKNGCRKLLDLSREMAVAAGYKGIHFIAMKWPEGVITSQLVSGYKTMGFDETGIYHFMDTYGRAENPRRYSYTAVADANPESWWRQHETGVLPFLPNLSTGWDDRPWNDGCEIYGKNADDFRRICVAAKAFADKTGQRRLCLAPLNEWGEGSYAEPNTEHGFGFYEAVRDVFCEKPAEGWPLNYGPKDVGLGPYDIPAPVASERRTVWSCRDGEPSGWSLQMGLDSRRKTPDGLSYRTTTRDPAVLLTFPKLSTRDFAALTVRMRTTDNSGPLQLFWGVDQPSMSERASLCLPLQSDGAWHTYRFDLSKTKAWRGRIGALRIDPGSVRGATVEFAEIRLLPAK